MCEGLLKRLENGKHVLVAEGYLFEMEQRGYLKAGAFVPEVVLENPDVVRMLHEEFVHAGSDVVEAFTYYAHRAKLDLIGRGQDLEDINRRALRLARQVANKTGTLMAGNICNTLVFRPDNREIKETVEAMFKEQIEWAVEEKSDYIIGETFSSSGEAKLALDCILKYGNGLPAVITMTPRGSGCDAEGKPLVQAMKQLEEAGAAVVGFNCTAGPDTILPIMRETRGACKGPLACLPVPYRTDHSRPQMQTLMDSRTGKSSFPGNLNPWHCSRWDIEDFTRTCQELGIQYLGLCCGNQAHYMRTLAETLGRKPPASKYSPDMTQHFSQKPESEDVAFARNAYARELEKTS